MKLKRIFRTGIFFLLVFGVFFPFSQGIAQDNTIKFRNLTIEDGLSQSSVNAIVQDKLGFIWLGTQDGLNRFDGYSFTVFKNHPGDSTSITDNFIHSLLEDRNHNLWVGTEGGLCRFDRSLNQFIRYGQSEYDPLTGQTITSLVNGRDGIIWVGTQSGGLIRLEISTGNIFQADLQIGQDKVIGIQSLFFDSNTNILWVGTTGSGLIKYNTTNGKTFRFGKEGGEKIGLSNDLVWSVIADKEGMIWAGTNNGLNRIDPLTNEITVYRNNPTEATSLSNDVVKVLYEDNEGNLWAGTEEGGINRFDRNSERFVHFLHQPLIVGSLIDNTVYSIFEDRGGILWVGTNRGLSKFDNTKQHFIHYRNIPYDPATISGDNIWSIIRDSDGVLLVGHDKGLDLLNAELFKTGNIKPPSSENTNQSVYALLEDSDGEIWIGTDGGIYLLSPDRKSMVAFTVDDRRDRVRVYDLTELSNGEIWAGTREGLIVISKDRKTKKKYSTYETPGYLPNNTIRVIFEARDGTIWVGTNGGGLVQVTEDQEGERIFKTYTSAQGLNANVILSLFEDEEGKLYIGTYGGGVNIYDPHTGKITFITEKDGLSNNVVYSIYKDSGNRLWMTTNRGVSVLNLSTGKVNSYFQTDGLQSNEFNVGAHYKDKSGQLFFGGINGFNAFYPERITQNMIPPQMVITNLKIFNRSVMPGENSPVEKDISISDNAVLSYKDDVITFEFAGLHYSSPEQNSYAYILEGFETNWNFVKGVRQVTYTNLDPGEYIFKVKGSNSDGVWSKTTADLHITIRPPFWQTWWFRIISAVSFIIVAAGLYKSRIAIIQSQKRHLEHLVKERTGKILVQKEKIEAQKLLLESEKEKVEKLLLNILPHETVEELKNKGKASARHYRTATVMFTDFKGFTRIAEQIRPKDLVAELDRYFIVFDGIVEKYGLEKIKTIGDAYMCAGGIPIRNKSNPIDMVLAALEIQRYMEKDKQEKLKKGLLPWELRIGINTGELIAGVVGIKRFAYDIWGDTVNVASRMESNGETGKVNISGVTYSYVKDLFDCTYRGKVDAKNKGEIDMYFVDGIRKEFASDEERIIPNELFKSTLANALFYKINYKKAEQFILKKLGEELSPDLYYHGLHHTIDVRDAAERIGKAEGIMGEDLMVLKTAAMYHDAGFVKQYFKNEPIGVEMAKEILPDFGYSPQQIQQVEDLIMSTQMPQKARNLMEMIICDADLDYLGRDDFHQIADTLKMELMARGKVKSDKEWDAIQISFLENHKYFTNYSKKVREPEKRKHIEEIKQRYKEDRYEYDTNSKRN